VARERNAFAAVLDRLERSELARTCLDLERMRSVLAALGPAPDPEILLTCMSVLVRGVGVGLSMLEFE